MIEIREASPNDVPFILSLINELANYEKLSEEVVTTEESLRAALFGERVYAEALIAEFEGGPKGYALFFHNFSTFLGKPGLYLEDLYVKQDARRHGIGKALLKALARIAKDRDCGRFEWSVLDWNQPAIEFYEKLGANILPDWRVARMLRPGIHQLAE